MKIGELSQKSGISQRMIRYYEEQRLLVPQRTESNYRNFSQDDVCRLGRIQILQDAGLTLKIIHSLLPCIDGETIHFDDCPLVLKVLNSEKEKIKRRVEILEESLEILGKYIEEAGFSSIANDSVYDHIKNDHIPTNLKYQSKGF
ncbi:MerR family transcriptional regulator [Sodalis sp. C49]|uniref:MerR family transcriptional regulator n=1 Tax=Sodalis sp. C49 TaxID=3228929 RepID=UPI003965990F